MPETPTIPEREITSVGHMMDMYPNWETGRIHQDGLTYYIYPDHEDTVMISRPVQRPTTTHLPALLDLLNREFYAVSLFGWPAQTWMAESTLTGESVEVSNHLYQIPRSEEEYTARIQRFCGSGLQYRQLEESDLPALKHLIDAWAQDKIKYMQTQNTDNVEIRKIAKLKRPVSYYKAALKVAGNRIYGAFRDEELLASTRVGGNEKYQVWAQRAGIRTNSTSPQEYLDYCVARELVQRGAIIFDRGTVQLRKGIGGLLQYKKKVGTLHYRPEVTVREARVRREREEQQFHSVF